MSDRGDRDYAPNDKCPKCGALYMADGGTVTFPVPPTHEVYCMVCQHRGPISDWWDAFDGITHNSTP